jgi:predicted permease
MIRDLLLRLKALFLRRRIEADLEDELAFHLDMQRRRNESAGMPADEARRKAHQKFGSAAAVRESCRDERHLNLVENLARDIGYAMRGFRRAPVFAITVVGTIGLGLGIDTAVFTIFNAYVLRPLAIHDPHSVYQVNWHNYGRGFSWTQYNDLRARSDVFQDVYASRSLQARIDGKPAFAELVSGNYFQMLGVGAALGRTLTPDDSSGPGRSPVMTISYRAWRNLFGADPGIVGRKIFVRGFPLEVIGVARKGFEGAGEVSLDFWAPLGMSGQLTTGGDLFSPSGPEALDLVGRLAPGLPLSQAQAALRVWARRISTNRPADERSAGIVLRSRATTVNVDATAMAALTPIFIAFALILLTACANVANMMLARAMARQREIGIRLSLGAGRARVIRQLLTESLLLSVPAALAGFVISRAALDIGQRTIFATLPPEFVDYVRITPLNPDLRVFAFTMVAALIAGVAFGLAPALQATRASVVQTARGDFGNDLRPQRMRNTLVAVQITICALLLICAGVLLRGVDRIHSLEIGFRTRDVVWMEVTEKSRAAAVARLETEPRARTVAAALAIPLAREMPTLRISAGAGRPDVTSCDFVSPELFDALGIPISQGRNFNRNEAVAGAAVAIVSETLARRLWPNGGAVGGSVHIAEDSRRDQGRQLPAPFSSAEVIGVAQDINPGMTRDENSRSLVYFPTDARAIGNSLLVRVNGDPEAARQRIDRDLSAAAPAGIESIHGIQGIVAGRMYPYRVVYWISVFLGGLALLLTVSGIYGVISYLVAQRTREFGIRMALGATPRGVTGHVLQQSLRLAGIGIFCGAVLALGASKLLASKLEMIDAYDRFAYEGGVAIVFAACLAASFIPSLRAARIDPMTTLRHD